MTLDMLLALVGLAVYFVAPQLKMLEVGRLLFLAASVALLFALGSHRLF